MPIIDCESVVEWGRQAITHMQGNPEHQVGWHIDPSSLTTTLACNRCDTEFSVSRLVLQQPDQSTRIVADFLRTSWGRERLLSFLLQKGSEGLKPGEHPFDPDAEPDVEGPRMTAWSRILDDGDMFDD